jgi:hypothetical protein
MVRCSGFPFPGARSQPPFWVSDFRSLKRTTKTPEPAARSSQPSRPPSHICAMHARLHICMCVRCITVHIERNFFLQLRRICLFAVPLPSCSGRIARSSRIGESNDIAAQRSGIAVSPWQKQEYRSKNTVPGIRRGNRAHMTAENRRASEKGQRCRLVPDIRYIACLIKVLKRDRRSIRQVDLDDRARHRSIAISGSVDTNGSQICRLKNVFETAPRRALSKDKVAPFLRLIFTAGSLSAMQYSQSRALKSALWKICATEST